MKGNSPLFEYPKRHSGRAAAGSGDGSLMSKRQGFYRNIKYRQDVDPDGVFDLIAHGTSTHIQVDHNGKSYDIDWRSAKRLIERMPGYKKGQPIRLLSCNTGSGSLSFAQNLANKMNVVVYAPNNILWAWPNGNHAVLGSKGGRPDRNQPGDFVEFVPGGNKK